MTAFSPDLRDLLRASELDPGDVFRVVRTALDEDLRFGPDVTSDATVPAGAEAAGVVVARVAGTIAGVPVARAVLELADALCVVSSSCADGTRVERDDVVLTVAGPTRSLLTVERTLLNLLCHLSGVATVTRLWADALAGTGACVRDTRKTTPGLRLLEKYAVRCGGGTNHRFGLGDAALIKDNHVIAAGGITAAVAGVRAAGADVALEVECDTVEQVEEAVAAGVTMVLLDNMSLDEMRAAVAVARAAEGVRLEASGGLTLERARAVAETGVDYLAVGALTHSAPALDLGLDLQLQPASA